MQQVESDGSGEPGVLPRRGLALLQHTGRRLRLRRQVSVSRRLVSVEIRYVLITSH